MLTSPPGLIDHEVEQSQWVQGQAMVTRRMLTHFPPGAPVFTGRPFDDGLFAEVDELLKRGRCPTGWLDIETPDWRLTCLIHQSRPYLAGMVDDEGFTWVPLADLVPKVRQIQEAVCGLYACDLVRVLIMAVHFRNRPDLHATTDLVDLAHVLTVLAQEGQDAALSLERASLRTLMFLQKGVPARLYFADGRADPGGGSVHERFLAYGFAPGAPPGRVEVFHRLRIEADPDAGKSLTQLELEAQPPPPVNVEIRLGGRMVLQRTFMPPAMFIGRDPTCELRLDNLNVSRHHARIIWHKGRFQVEDLGSSNGTLVNGRKVEKQELSTNDTITVGKFSVQLKVPALPSLPESTIMVAPSTAAQRQLFVVGENVSAQLSGELTVGKVAGVDIRVRGFGVRPIHARLHSNGDGTMRLECVGKARALVGGQKIQTAVVRPGQPFQIGRKVLKLIDVPLYAEVAQL